MKAMFSYNASIQRDLRDAVP